MRVIKFRGKRVDNGEWVYGDVWSMPNNGFAIVNDGNQWCESKNFSPILVIPETVGQFIGQTDKNGVEIYENDIVRHPDGRAGMVEYVEDNCYFDTNSHPHLSDIEVCVYYDQLEVIGHIHQDAKPL
jgi:uncharacterized phage protein (TIGR01671 family)